MARMRIAVIAVLIFPVLVAGGSGPADGPVSGRLVYLFYPGHSEHQHRALQLQEWVAGNTGTQLLLGILPAGSGDAPDAALIDQLRLPLLTTGQLREAGLPDAALSQVPEDGDFAMYFNSYNNLQWTARGVDAPVQLRSQELTTDVGHSTWGKIKELFQ